jgi:predicted DCC family thiol-disulfide oxidoreductase YuxK
VKVVYFDGYCNVCNTFVNFLILRDKKRVLKFASLQSKTAEQRLNAKYSQDVDTMVFEDGGVVTVRSTGAINSVAALGGFYRAVKIFLLVPRFLRDGFYDWFARHRYLWFGKRETCRIASPEERAQFLN